MAPERSAGRACISAAVVLLCGAVAPAADPAKVLVIYNAASSDGAQIANYYSQVHPGVTLLGLSNIPTDETITSDVYLRSGDGIRTQVLGALAQKPYDYIVTTKGLPLRIDNGTGSGNWNRFSSLESELTRVDKIGTAALMGNQSWQTSSPLAYNPYRCKNTPFSYATYGMRLTARLDGFNVTDVKGAIDRAQKAVVGKPGYSFIVDDSPGKVSRMPQLAANVLAPRGLAWPQYNYDATTAFVNSAPGPVLGYDSHGVNGGAPAGYLSDPTNGVRFKCAPGAIFQSWESYNAYTFTQGGSVPGNQGQVAEWIHRGGTAGVGQVEEPIASYDTVANDDRIYDRMLSGYTWGEAAWNAMTQLSYVNTVVGDPLMTWKQWTPGDVNLDGMVDLYDLSSVTSGYGSVAGDARYNAMADMNADGQLNLWDLSYVSSHYTGPVTPADTAAMASVVPEPSALGLAAIAGLTLLRKRRGEAAAIL